MARDLDGLPDPLTPADCDLRGLEWMPLYGDRLFSSDTWLLASSEGKVAALALWWAAWHQVPAGSLPDNDRVLAQLAGYGMAVRAWLGVREEALRGFVVCNDRRLHHPVVAKLALEAWERRKRERDKKQAYRAKRNDRHSGNGSVEKIGESDACPRGQDGDKPPLSTGTGEGTNGGRPPSGPGPVPPPVPGDRTGQDRTEEEREESGSDSPLDSSLSSARGSVSADGASAASAASAGGASMPADKPPPDRRGNRLPDDWQPRPEDIAFARERGLDPFEAAAEFRDFWRGVPGAKGRKLDWDGTFRNRCRELAAKRRPARGGFVTASSSREAVLAQRATDRGQRLQRDFIDSTADEVPTP